MASSQRPYISCVRSTLQAALCIQSFPCQQVERQSKPEVEYGTDPELLLRPVTITRNASERCHIEGSINSVRVSLKVKEADQLDKSIKSMFMRFLSRRADKFDILRKVPLEGYDISFLITSTHLEIMERDKVVDFICEFMEDIDSEISDLKLGINKRARAAAAEMLRALAA